MPTPGFMIIVILPLSQATVALTCPTVKEPTETALKRH